MLQDVLSVLFLVSPQTLALDIPSHLETNPSNRFERVDNFFKGFDSEVMRRRDEFARLPADPKDREWVKSKLKHMVDVDQYMRSFSKLPFEERYSENEKQYFWEEYYSRWIEIDSRNTKDLKSLLRIYDWIRVSEFDEAADNNAWLIVQHADHDRAFQKRILEVLIKLYPEGETSSRNYAYLFDRVAVAWNDPGERRPQRYGTQGQCVGPGKWEPMPMEDPSQVDERRAEVGLEPLEDYKNRFKEICK